MKRSQFLITFPREHGAASATSSCASGSTRRVRVAFVLSILLLPAWAQAIDLGNILPGIAAQTAAQAQRAAAQAQRDAEKAQRAKTETEGCGKLKTWVASVPSAAGSLRPEDWMPLLEDERFTRSFGKPYDQLTIADFRELQQTQLACQRAGTLTPGEMQTVQYLLNPSMQPQLSRQLVATRAQRGELNSLLAELDGLPATDQGLQRLDAISARLAALLRGASADDSRATQARLDATRTRVALPVHTTRINRLIAEARGAEGITALAVATEDLNRTGLGAQADPLKRQASDRIRELAAPMLQEERAGVAALPSGLPGLERGVTYYGAFSSKYQKAIGTVPEFATFRNEFLAHRASTIASVTPELTAEVRKAKSEAEINAVLSRYLLDAERQQSARGVTSIASERVAALRQAGESQRVFGATAEPVAAAAAPERSTSTPATAKDGKVLTDPNELRKYEAGTIVRAIYHADLAGLRAEPMFTRKYLISQAEHLGGNCDSFKITEIRAYEARFQKEVMTSVQQNMGQLLRDGLNMYVQAQRNMASIVDAGAVQQRLDDAPDLAVRDVERLAKTYGGCDAPVIVRYTRNLRAYLDRAR